MADWPVRAAAAFTAALGFAGEEWHIVASTDDMLQSAYRMAPCSQPQYTVMAVRMQPSGEVGYLLMSGFNFGLRSAVPIINRIPHFSIEMMRGLLGGVYARYFDDIVCTKPSWASAPCAPSPIFPDGTNSVQTYLWRIHFIMGFPLATN